jgi:KDO II ethanolaminephosphotransferase
VIGETTRWDHMGLLGYHRNTTPELERQANTVVMKGTSCNTVTKLSLQCMFVRPGSLVEGDDDAPSFEREDNVFAVFKKLGFTIDLFAMQSEVGFYNRTHADFYKFREVIASEPYNAGKPVDDALLIREMSDAIERRATENPNVRHLIILHTKGSHHEYSQRYPRSFARFTPECKNSDAFCTEAAIINAFDNSVLYVDTVLSALMDRLGDKPAMLFYAADHGESIDENRRFHGTPKFMAPPEQLAVPIIAWASDVWLQQPSRRDLFRNLRKHHQQTAHHQDLFASLLGCLGIESPDGGIDASHNWCSPASLDKRAN